MQTPIEFAQNFLVQVYTKQDAAAALACLSPDMIWVTPEKSVHLKEQKEVYDFLKEQIKAAGEKYYVDVSNMMSDPSAENIRTVTFDVNFVPVDPTKTIICRTSFVIRSANDGWEILFFHMSRKFSLSNPEPFHEFIEYLPEPFLIVRGHGTGDLRLAYQNSWFLSHLGYTKKEFDKLSKKNQFFMFLPADRDQLVKLFAEPVRNTLRLRVTAKRKNGSDFHFEVAGRYAFTEEDAKISYLEFHAIDDMLKKQRADLDAAAESHLKEIEKIQDERDSLQSKLDSYDSDKEAEIKAVKEDATKRIDEVRNESADRVELERKKTAKILEASKQEQERVRKEIEQEKETALSEQKEEAEKKLAEQKAESDKAYEEARTAAAELLSKTKEEDQAKIDSLSENVKDLSSQLEEANAQTEELRNKLEESEAAAKKAEEGRKEFLARCQDELRKPSEATLALLSSIEAGGLGEKQKDSVEKIREASSSMLDMVDSLLSASSIDNHRRTLKNEEFVFPDMLREIRLSVSRRCRKKNISLRFEVQEGIPEVCIGDREALKRVLLNILDNSIRYTGEGGQISFEAAMQRMEGNECPMSFSIIDTGVGIEDSLLPVLFEPFTRGTVPTEDPDDYPGFGLGLATANSFVKMMGGSIGVTSTPGVGSYFTVQVRLTAAMDQHGRLKEARDIGRDAQGETPQTQIPKGEFSGVRVLLVEDDPLSIEQIRELLARKGIAAVRSSSGSEAVRLFRANPAGTYGAVLVDYHMPVMDGLETARRIRGIEKERKEKPTPIIALTQSAFEEDMAASLGGTIDAGLGKPVDPAKLYSLLNQVLKK